jgi:putative FmdB family regulatory protein
MPIYEYLCRACGAEFEELVLAGESVACPRCRAERAEKQLSTFATARSDSAARERASERASAPGPCGSCGDPRGPGSCA